MFDTILSNIDKMQAIVAGMSALIGAIVGVVLTAIAAWHQINNAYKDGGEDMLKVVEEAVPLITKQEFEKKPNEDKNFVVSEQLLQTAKKPLKKFKLDDIVLVGGVVSQIYGFIKPLFGKKK